MPDLETPAGTPEAPAGTPPPEGSGNGQEPKPSDTQQDDTDPRLKEARKEAASYREKLRLAEKERDALKAEKLTEQERIAMERDGLRQELEALKADLARRDREALAARAAAQVFKNTEQAAVIAPLLQGDDEAAMVKHAQTLAKTFAPKAPADDLGPRGGGGGDIYTQIRQEKQREQESAGTHKPFVERLGLT